MWAWSLKALVRGRKEGLSDDLTSQKRIKYVWNDRISYGQG